MARGETTEEFAVRKGPGWVSDAARICGDRFGLDAESLDELAEDHGWEHHDPGYDDKIKDLAQRWQEIHGVNPLEHASGSEASS